MQTTKTEDDEGAAEGMQPCGNQSAQSVVQERSDHGAGIHNPLYYREPHYPNSHTAARQTIRLLLVGKTGCGKSATGNTILGQMRFKEGPDFGSITKKCEKQVGFHRTMRIEVMDTPGLFDTRQTQEEISAIIMQAVVGMHPGPHAILFIIRIGRFTQEQFAAYCRLKALFDERITHHIILVFTCGDHLEREGVTLQSLLESHKAPGRLRVVTEECGHRCISINNMAPENRTQVDVLLRHVERLMADNNGLPYACPKYMEIGERFDEEINMRIKAFEKKNLRQQEYVQDLERKNRDAKYALELTRKEFEELECRHKQEAEEKEKENAEMEEGLQQVLHEYEKLNKQLYEENKKLKQLLSDFDVWEDKKQKLQDIEEQDNKYETIATERQRSRNVKRGPERDREQDMESPERVREQTMERLNVDEEAMEAEFLQKDINNVTKSVK